MALARRLLIPLGFQFDLEFSVLRIFLLTIVVTTNILMVIMTGKLAEEIQQTKPFKSLEEELILNLERTVAVLRRPFDELLKAHRVSRTQYNVLRILRGAGPKGLGCGQIAERLITYDPDITRLLDRLEREGLVERRRDLVDRRVIMTRITGKGLKLLGSFDVPLSDLLQELLGHLKKQEARTLVGLLEKARAPHTDIDRTKQKTGG